MIPPVRECPECGADVERAERIRIPDVQPHPAPRPGDLDEPPEVEVSATEWERLLPCGHDFDPQDMHDLQRRLRSLVRHRREGERRLVVSEHYNRVEQRLVGEVRRLEDEIEPREGSK